MVRVALVSDTHVPSRASEIPSWVLGQVREADHTIHAGDFDTQEAFDTMIHASDGGLTAVAGNTDSLSQLPSGSTIVRGGVEFVVMHGSGPFDSYRDRLVSNFESVARSDSPVGVAGHTHQVLDETVGDLRLLNPGSATGAPPADEATMMVAECDGGDIFVDVLTSP
jgi:putative phosphoesterase